MRKTLLATTALACAGALAAAPASAADKLSVGVGGYMQQWFGYVDRDDNNSEGGVDTQADSEVYFQGSMESDAGLKFGVHVQLEANAPTGIDESFAHIGGAFGRLEIGARDSIQARTHYGISDVGVALNAGDTQKWIPGAYLDTNGWLGDNLNLIYISPRVSGVQVGLSYGPDAGNESAVTTAPNDNDDAVWAAGINFNQAVGDASFKLSLGHRVRSQADSTIEFKTGDDDAARKGAAPLTPNDLAGAMGDITAHENARDLKPAGTAVPWTEAIAKDAADGTNAIAKATDGKAMVGDNDTFTNVGMQVGFGAFQFNVAYAQRDKGTYKAVRADVPVKADGSPVIEDGHAWDHDSDSKTDAVAETAERNDPGNDVYVAEQVVKDGAGEWDVWGVSVRYTDGPMALSLGHMVHETEAGGERTATMLSASYTLAPGVAWRSSAFAVEDDTGAGAANEGTAFVTGITLNF